MANDPLNAALDYARRGWLIIPLHTPKSDGTCDCYRGKQCGKNTGKHPRYHSTLCPNGLNSGTTDEKTIRQMWAEWPNANVGIVTGAISGIVTTDIDPRNGGDSTWARCLEGHTLPDTPIANTGGGGQHVIFAHPGGEVKSGSNRLGPGLDLKADGGYIVAPPSLHASGKRYQWAYSPNGKPPAALPDWLAQAILSTPDKESSETLPVDPWHAYTLADAYAPRPPVAYIVAGIFTLPSLNMVYGDSGSLKSMLLADLAVCVAAGLDWLTPPPGQSGAGLATLQAPVMWIDFDNGLRRTHERFEALARARNLPPDLPIFYYSMPSPWLDAGDTDAMGDLAGRIEARGVKLLVVDNLGLVSGDADENKADMTRVMGGFRWLCENTGAAAQVIHHQNKPNGVSRKAGDTLRGHSSIKAALDVALLVERGEDDPQMITFKCAKSRDGDIPTFGAQFSFEHKPGTKDLALARFWPVEVVDPKTKAADELKAQILAKLAEGPKKVREILALVHARNEAVAAALEELERSKQVKCEPGRNRSKVYSLWA